MKSFYVEKPSQDELTHFYVEGSKAINRLVNERNDLRAENERLELEVAAWKQASDLKAKEIERLQELLRGTGASRYWEGRWRDEKAENDQLRAQLVSDINAETEIEKLEAENERLQIVLGWYARPDNSRDQGEKARRALEGGE